jgi:hypothetical protein
MGKRELRELLSKRDWAREGDSATGKWKAGAMIEKRLG